MTAPVYAPTQARPLGRRERKKEQTRTALIDQCRGLLETLPAPDVTIDHVAELADVSSRTFFRYFDTKLDCVFAACGLPTWLTADVFDVGDDALRVATDLVPTDAGVILIGADAVGIDRPLLRSLVAQRALTTGELVDRLAGGELERLPAAAIVVVALLKES